MQLFVNDLTVIDFSYLCPIRGMVGESWIVDVILDGGLDDQNMVLDFGHVKRIIKQTIDEVVDHRLLIPRLFENTRITKTAQSVKVDFNTQQGKIALACPEQAFAFIDTKQIDVHSVTVFLQQQLAQALPQNIHHIELILRSEEFDTPYYHYSHGLKKHNGNCQRIAHGHRSPIKIYENQQRALTLETSWAKRWEDIYLASEEDCVLVEQFNFVKLTSETHYGFSYTAPQGLFQLAMPKQVCEIIPHDTTIELLAQFIAKDLAEQQPKNHYKVIAFEGVGKGSIAETH